jgi:Tfp pilus assembly protein PilF
MSQRRTAVGYVRALLVALVALAPVLGCSTWGHDASSRPMIPPFFGGTAESSRGGDQELPPKQSARACLTTAEEMRAKGHVEQAIFLYEKARRDDPTLSAVAHPLADLYDQQGDGVRALAEYKKALAAAPKDADVQNDFGCYYYRRGSYAEAEPYFRKALSIAPEHQQAGMNLALVLAHEGHFAESYQAFARVVGPAAAHSNVGVLLAKAGRTDEARQEFRQALALDCTLKQPQAFLAYLDKPR